MEAHFASMATMQRAHEMFNAACARYPNAPALLKTEDGEKTMLTYEQLMTWARAVFEALVNRIDSEVRRLRAARRFQEATSKVVAANRLGQK